MTAIGIGLSLEEDGEVKETEPKKMLDEGSFKGNPPDPNTPLELIVPFDEIYASVISGSTGEPAEGYRPSDPHRPALTAHAENIARTWGARLFGNGSSER